MRGRRVAHWAAYWAAVALLVVFMLGALVEVAVRLGGTAPGEAPREGSGATVAEAVDDPVRVLDGEAESGAFLERLESQSGTASGEGEATEPGADAVPASPASVSWTEEGGVVEMASRVLNSYQEVPGAVLMTSGYLDLKGNAWGAIVRGGGEWVDIVLIVTAETEPGAEDLSSARVVRLAAGTAPTE